MTSAGRKFSAFLGELVPHGKGRSWDEILGMNARTLFVAKENPPQAILLVNDKQATKDALGEAGVPVPPTIELVRNRRDLADLDWEELPDSWVLKPNMGSQGAGLLIADERDGDGWRKKSGEPHHQERPRRPRTPYFRR